MSRLPKTSSQFTPCLKKLRCHIRNAKQQEVSFSVVSQEIKDSGLAGCDGWGLHGGGGVGIFTEFIPNQGKQRRDS